MSIVIFYAITGFLLLLSRWIGKRWYVGYFLGGLAFGLYNEICFEFCWDYSPALGPMIWRDVPLIVVLGWGVVTNLALCVSDRIYSWRQVKNEWIRRLLDIVVFVGIGFSNEVLMSSLKYWEYNVDLHSTVVVQILGYAFVGLLVSSTGRTITAIKGGSAPNPA